MMNNIVNNFTKKFVTLATLVVLCSLPTTTLAKSSVWKVSKNNDHVYIGGTIHVLPEEHPMPSEFINAFNNTDQLILEAQLPDPNDAAAQQAMIAKMSYTNGDNLQSKLTPETFKLLTNYFTTIGSNVNQFTSFKPGFVITIMALIELQKAQISGEGVDAFFEAQATIENKKIDYLETADMQFTMLSQLGEGYEDEFILANLELNSSFTEFFGLILDAWQVGDSARLESLINDAALDSDEKSYEALFSVRNKNWVPKIEAMFNNKHKELVLVGAGHLFGKDGLLALLKKQGYTIEQSSL
ncbi:TraB/GumN family protein [Pseudocolwellia agarivorans]|uniref:TraB/GumN family protein n=1 Tax=Pseudocolwellia agarivorans TaxID=1911682 RepID=UPI003F884366